MAIRDVWNFSASMIALIIVLVIMALDFFRFRLSFIFKLCLYTIIIIILTFYAVYFAI